MTIQKTYDDEMLATAVASSRSWRGVLRALGLHVSSGGATRMIQREVDRLGLDHSHFTGQRRWTDADLIQAVAGSRSWKEVTAALGIQGGSSYPLLKGHALRLGLDTSHIGAPVEREGSPWALVPSPRHLRQAGSMLAASWFALCGYEVSWPLEPCRYDLLVHSGAKVERVQVKTTTQPPGTIVRLAPGDKRFVYDPDEIDSFFIIDRELRYYLIPVAVVGGRRGISLRAYADYIVSRPGFPEDAQLIALPSDT
ncbi:MAG: group I intron-associated PD-(D/E)XK endonuclease [Aeromicrobium sp.]